MYFIIVIIKFLILFINSNQQKSIRNQNTNNTLETQNNFKINDKNKKKYIDIY
jgi:hypothetical protein